MKKLNFAVFVIFCLSLIATQCSQDSIPIGPEVSTGTQPGDAVLLGNFVTAGTNSVDFGLVEVTIRGTNIQTQPDSNGDFEINGLPTGNQSVEVNVESQMSAIDIADIQSGEEIRMQLEIQANNSVMLQNMQRDRKSAESLQLEIRTKKWNIDWENSTDEVQARIYGAGFDTINSVEINGPDGSIPVIRTETGGVYFKAFFSQKDAIASILDPKRGDYPVITVTVTQDTELGEVAQGVTDRIEIVGKKSDEDKPRALVMDISPNKWNTKWGKSNGYVTVRFRGDGFDTIAHEFTKMSHNGGLKISPASGGIHGSSYSAKFLKKQAITLFGDLERGKTYSVNVTVQFDGGSELTETCTISIVGSKK